MWKNQPLLSIVIPTKDRYDTLIPVVDSFLNHIVGDDYEIVIQDNSGDNSRWLQYAKTRQDEKIRYFYDAVPVPIKDNVNRAFDNALGEYWIFIGDDDFVSPYILDVVKMMKEKEVEALIYTLSAYYFWGDVQFKSENYYQRKNAFWMPQKTRTNLIKKNSKHELNQVLRKGGVSYIDLPRLYNGIVKREAMYNIKNRVGNYVVGSCPDMSLCVSLTFILNEYYYIDYPVGVFGHSGIRFNNKEAHFAKLDNVPFLPKNIREIWNPSIPRYWCNSTIWPQTVCETLQAFHSNKRINFIPCYVSIIINYRKEKQIVRDTLGLLFSYSKFNILKYLEFIYLISYLIGRRYAGQIYRSICHLLKIRTRSVTVSILPTAEDVMKFLKQYPYNK
ncbi:MAG: glycosyltransferase [Prevotellaceae bacterium]|jgi:glycosyltransferase involved in cell wall biosynthesis|nr:glycosyltransferase [Prevotellaceae bacterium]